MMDVIEEDIYQKGKDDAYFDLPYNKYLWVTVLADVYDDNLYIVLW